jgi:hypothetical protein
MSAVYDDDVGFDDASETPQPQEAQKTDRSVAAITTEMARVQNSLTEFERVSAGLAELEARYPKDAVYDVTTTKGMKEAIEHRAAWRDPRIMVEKARKMAKAPLLALGKNIDARAAWLTEKLREGEEPIDKLIKAEEQRREDERQARAAAEAGRILAIQEALAAIAEDVVIACGKTSDDVQALLERMSSTEPDPAVFQEMIEQARSAWAAGIAKLETAHKAKLWEEAEQRRVEEERQREEARRQEEAERQARIAAENARLAEELAAQKRALEEQAAELERQKREIEEAQQRASTPVAEEAPHQSTQPTGPADEACRPETVKETAQVAAESADIAKTRQTAIGGGDDAKHAGDMQGPAGEAFPMTREELSEAAGAVLALLGDCLELTQYASAAFAGRFPSHPKPGPDWWVGLRERIKRLQPMLEQATGEQ